MKERDIQTPEDVKQLVDTFYSKVQKDQKIGPIFNGIIRDKWPEHLEKMYGFWQTILFAERKYFGSPFPPHAKLPIDKEHFGIWLNLFEATVDKLFTGPKANEVKQRANQIALAFQSKIAHLKSKD